MKTPGLSLSIPKDAIHALEPVTFTGSITVVDRAKDVPAAFERIMEADVVGFDTETKPSFRKGKPNKVALMQISTNDHAWLFRLNKTGITPEMHNFIQSPKVKKIGLSLRDDFFVMHRSGEFEPKGFIDLQNMVRDYCIADSSLQRIYAIIFGRRISKSQRLTNWEAPGLTPAQQAYAAIDAWACLHIYETLQSGEFRAEESPYIVKAEETEA